MVPDLRAILNLICDILNIKYAMPQNFIPFRWLSVYDAAQDLSRLFHALVLFYFSFLCSPKQNQFLHLIVKIYRQHSVSEEGREKIRNLQVSLQKKLLTEAGKERKNRICLKLFDKHIETKLNIALFISVLPLLQEYVKIFQTGSPLIHLIHDKQMELLKNFMACFVRPEVLLSIGYSAKKIKYLDVEERENQLPLKSVFVGEMAKNLIKVAPKSCLDVIKTFQKNTLKAYVACAKALQNKMPITNQFLKAVSSIDPWCRQHSLSLELMKQLPEYVKNVINSEEKEQYDLDIHKYQVDHSLPPPKKDYISSWWIEIDNSQKYPLLSRMALALLTCFHGPKVESSFSAMNNIITPGSSRMNVSTFDAIQSVKYELSAKKQTSVAFYSKKDFLKDPVDRNLCRNMRTAYKKYSKEKLENNIMKENKRKSSIKSCCKKDLCKGSKKTKKDACKENKVKIQPPK